MDSVDNLCELLIYCFNEGLSPTNIIDWKRLLELADSDSLEVRVCLAKALVNQPVDTNTVELLVKLTKDPSPNVRVEAVDTLGAFPTKASYDRLCVCLNDSNQLVRAYASFGVAVVGKEISPQSALKVLQEKEYAESNKRVMVNIYEGLYILGSADALRKLIELFNSEDYRVKCAVLHAMCEILNPENKTSICDFLQSFDLSAFPVAVSASAELLMEMCAGR